MENEVEIPIDDGIPVPQPRRYTAKYTTACRKLEVGQSFVTYGPLEADRARGASQRVRQETGAQFTQRKLDDNFWRLWRIK